MTTHLSRPLTLLSADASEPPREIRLFSAGVVATTKGNFTVDKVACESVARAFAALGRLLPFDYEHASLSAAFAPDLAEAGKAAGQFKVECRDGAIWATDIQWTPPAREKILAREYVYVSPTFRTDDDSRVVEIFGAAITNDPATLRASPILSLTGKTTEAEALSVVAGWKTSAEQAAVQLSAANARIATLEKREHDREADELVTLAQREGRLPPALAARARAIGAKDLVLLKDWLAGMPKIGGERREPEGGEPGAPVTLTAEERRQCRSARIPEEQMLKTKRAQLARRAGEQP